MEQDELLSLFKQELARMTGETCYGYVDWLAPESIMLSFKGEFQDPESYTLSLLGVWQLTNSGYPVCAYIAGINHDGQLYTHLNRLKSQRVAEVRFREPEMNLYVLFDSGLKLSLFSNRHSPKNYLYFYRRVKYLSESGKPPASIDGGFFDVDINLKLRITWMQSGSE